MPKKTKKKVKKVVRKKKGIGEIMTVPMPKSRAMESVEDTIGALISLQATPGWAIIVKILKDNIAYLEKAIIDKIDPVSKEGLSETEIEEARLKRNLNLELLNTPKNYTQKIKDAEAVPKDYDPYFKTKKEIDTAFRPRDDRGE